MNKKERIGGLRNRVTIQGVTEVQSVTGYPAETWATYATRWAGVDYATNTQSDEDELTSAKTAKTTATFTLRYDATVTQKHRIVYAGLVWDIESIAPDAVREFMVLRCRNYGQFAEVEALKIAIMQATANGTLSASGQLVKIASATFSASAVLSATAVTDGAVILIAESNLIASAILSAQAQKAKQAESQLTASATLAATTQRAKLAQLNAISSATLQAMAIAEQQGIQNAYAMLYGVAGLSATGQVARQAQLAATGQATLSASAQKAKVAEFNQQATALLSATLAAIRVVSAQFTAQAETSLTAQLSRAVSASVQAQAETNLQAIVSRAVSASMTAQGSISLLAVLANQVVFLASAGGTLSATGKVAKQAAFSRSATGTVSGVLKRAVYRSASLTASATLSATGNLYDPNFSNVSLLLHGDGTNGGTTFTDNSPNAFTPSTITGSAQTSTTQVKFGSASIYLTTNSMIEYADNAAFDLGSGDYTIEHWMYVPSLVSTNERYLCKEPTTGTAANCFRIRLDGTAAGANAGKLNFIVFNSSNTVGLALATTNAIPTATWFHYAVTKSGNVYRAFINGVQEATQTVSGLTIDNAQAFRIGKSDLLSTQWIDDLRITKGVARYTTNFTPPTRQFLDQ